ncbi:MAG TPA: FtsX-like permease family protein, partial [Bryobacteraceae bacterium]|nr:FtsX-like permease family protein [Bryobacteraceae bacterium]
MSALFQRMVVPEGVHLDAAKIPRLIVSPGRRGFDPIGGSESRALWILLLLGGLVLLIVCANIANLLLSRAVARQREAAVCLALGAARTRVVRQHLVESVLLACAGGALGLLLGYVLTQSVHSVIQTSMGIGGFDLHINIRMLAYTAGVSLLTALLFGLAPAFRMANANVNEALKAHSRSVLTGRLRLPRALVSFQIALCLTILVAAGLLGRSLLNLKRADIGFNRNNLVYVSVNPWRTGARAEQVSSYVDRIRMALKVIPGIQRVAVIEVRPLSGAMSTMSVNIPGRPYRQDGADSALFNNVSDELFETLGIPVMMGRTFSSRDMQPTSKAVIVDDLFARKYFPNENPLGRQFGSGPKPAEYYQIVGVVKNSRYHNLRSKKQPTMYRPFVAGQSVGSNVNFAIRAGIDSRQLGSAIRRAAASVDPAVPVIEIQTQTSLIDKILLMDRLLGILSSTFGIVALVLSAVGLAGLLAYAVARRRNEIGIRMALGASSRDIVRLVLQDSLWLVGMGILVGAPSAFALGQVLKGSLFGLQPADPVTLGFSFALLAIVAAFAAWLPA